MAVFLLSHLLLTPKNDLLYGIQKTISLIFNLELCRPMSYTTKMNFEWDEAKSEVCFTDRGFDFLYATQAFFDPSRILHDDTRYSYGEERYQLMGMIEQRLYVVVFTQRHEVTRIISARKANQREVRHYEDCTCDS